MGVALTNEHFFVQYFPKYILFPTKDMLLKKVVSWLSYLNTPLNNTDNVSLEQDYNRYLLQYFRGEWWLRF